MKKRTNPLQKTKHQDEDFDFDFDFDPQPTVPTDTQAQDDAFDFDFFDAPTTTSAVPDDFGFDFGEEDVTSTNGGFTLPTSPPNAKHLTALLTALGKKAPKDGDLVKAVGQALDDAALGLAFDEQDCFGKLFDPRDQVCRACPDMSRCVVVFQKEAKRLAAYVENQTQQAKLLTLSDDLRQAASEYTQETIQAMLDHAKMPQKAPSKRKARPLAFAFDGSLPLILLKPKNPPAPKGQNAALVQAVMLGLTVDPRTYITAQDLYDLIQRCFVDTGLNPQPAMLAEATQAFINEHQGTVLQVIHQ